MFGLALGVTITACRPADGASSSGSDGSRREAGTSSADSGGPDADVGSETVFHGVTTQSWISHTTPATQQPGAISAEVTSYEAAAGRTVAWVAFANEFSDAGRVFPTAIATVIKGRGATPFIYLNLRSGGLPEPLFTLGAINAGQFDADLGVWADGARDFGSQVIVDWGWEMNIDDAPWNGVHNGGPVEGPQRYRQAFRHIVELMRSRGARNIHWAFHLNLPEHPAEAWNAFESYYPGDDVVDSTGVSIYGAQSPIDESPPSFIALLDAAYPRLLRMAPSKPIMVYEFGTTAGHPVVKPAAWADEALTGLLSRRWPNVRGFAWWNERFQTEYSPGAATEMRLEQIPELGAVFKAHLVDASNLGDRGPLGR